MHKVSAVRRSYILASITVVLTLLSIWGAFIKTYSAWQLNKELHTKTMSSSNLNYQPAYMERKFRNLEKIIALYTADSVTYRNRVLAASAKLADEENIKMVEMPGNEDAAYLRTNLYQIQRLGFEGDFFKLTRFYNRIQSAPGIGRVRASQFTLVNQPTSVGTRKTLRFYLFLERKL